MSWLYVSINISFVFFPPPAPPLPPHCPEPAAAAAQNRKMLPRLCDSPCFRRRSITVGRRIINNHRPAATAHIDFVLLEDSIKSQRGDAATGCSVPLADTFNAGAAAAGVAGNKMRENGDEVEGSTVRDEKHKQSPVLESPVGTRGGGTRRGLLLLSSPQCYYRNCFICLLFPPVTKRLKYERNLAETTSRCESSAGCFGKFDFSDGLERSVSLQFVAFCPDRKSRSR